MRTNPKYKDSKYVCLEIINGRDEICNEINFRTKIKINPKYRNLK